MSFGAMRELYRGTTGHYPYSANTNAYHLGRLTGDVASMYLGLQEIAFGMGTMGGGIAAGATGAGAVTTPALTAAGAAAIAHGGTSVYRASQNLADNLSRFSAGTSGKVSPTNGKASSQENIFPADPADFNPTGLQKIGPFNTKNGRIIKWIDPKTKKAKYEWDEDLKHGAHYHKIAEDGNTRIPDETGNTHFAPGDKY